MRIGIGYDVHRLVKGRSLVLGGVVIEHPLGLDGHSDADVLLHAIADALLGAVAMGDIGFHFPPGDPQWKDVSSLLLLKKVSGMLFDAGWIVGNIDTVILVQEPRIAPYVQAMREAIADCLGTSIDRISVKATTTERLGFVGLCEGIAAHAVTILERA